MKCSKFTLTAATVSLLCTSMAYGQAGSTLNVRQPGSVEQTSASYESYYAGEEATSSVASSETFYGEGGDSCDSCGSSGTCDSCSSGCDTAPWTLFDFGECSPWTIGGWSAQGITLNPDSPADRFNSPQTFNDRSNEFQLNQLYLFMERATDTEANFIDFGGRVDLLYGTDWRFTSATGLEVRQDGTQRWNQSNRFYGLAMPQLYGEVAIGDLSVKLGHFYTIIGYEVVTAPDNFFYSRSYTQQYGEPFTHTGALGTYALSDSVSVSGGIIRGWDTWEDPDINDNFGWLGGITMTGDVATLAWAMVWSDETVAAGPGGAQDRYMQSVVGTVALLDNLNYIAQCDVGHQNQAGGIGTADAEWYGFNQYLLMTLNDTWSAGLRAEWFRDDDGFRVGSLAAPQGSGRGGFAGDFYGITGGLNWRPHSNLVIRPEMRWDWYDGAVGNGGLRPYDDGSDNSQFTTAIDAILTY